MTFILANMFVACIYSLMESTGISRISSLTGRKYSFLSPSRVVMTTAFRTLPSLLFTASVTRPIGQALRCACSSLTRTTSPSCRSLLVLHHFCLCCRFWRYSCLHLDQKLSARYCMRLHQRRAAKPRGS